ncbi:DUF4097 family beta strand repeat-containing protein [Mobilicoccus pelagius]|uniref:DUF4097 domain-containing protein n=1 Tax=Mobilicoccus pelagius NBRC 104925 TaxID=1089455 RepID=H5UMU5_9MICO|nr:DUF4097 family beta strand repeat-containing protein [Mobilicoccus pelagius]GAB47053.1 hypothetical protein MOPEL_003_00770 [Mobilicoccus pelagius NBRC 104925]
MNSSTEQIEAVSTPAVRDFARPRSVTVTIVGGSVDVIAAPLTEDARLEVPELSGPPLTVTWTDGALKIEQVRGSDGQLWSGLKAMLSGLGSGSGTARARLTLTVPDEAAVSVRTVGADVLVGGTQSATVYTATGSVALDRPTGCADVTTASGSVDAASPSGELRVKTVSGDITVQDAVLRSTRLNTVSGRALLDLRHGPSLVTANSVSGEVCVRLPAGSGYDATVASSTGHVVVAGEPLVEDGNRGGHRYGGDRSVVIKARTMTGDLLVLHRDARLGTTPGPGGPVIGDPTPGTSGIQDDVRPGGSTWPRDPGDDAGTNGPGSTR